MKVLITGGAGFIGSHLADQLLARGDSVLVIDNYATGRRDNLAPHPRLRVVEGTIANGALVQQTFDEFKPEMVVHAAASYKDPNAWDEDAATNVVGTAHVVAAARQAKVSRLVYFQTALCYGLRPIEQPITLTHPLHPEGSSYAISKTAGEHYVALSGLDFISFRLANAYGPRNLSGPLPTFYRRLTSKAQCFVADTRRDFVYVDDLISVVLKAIDGRGRKGAYHVSSGSDFAIKELYDETVAALALTGNADVEVRPRGADDAPSILLDPSVTQVDFEWKTTTPLKQGVGRAIEFYRQTEIQETYTHLKQVTESK